MNKVHCHTNLDLSHEIWPDSLPAIPRVGDKIESQTRHGIFRLSLEVVSVTWKYKNEGHYYPEIELSIPKGRFLSLTNFYEWYASLVGRSVSAFI